MADYEITAEDIHEISEEPQEGFTKIDVSVLGAGKDKVKQELDRFDKVMLSEIPSNIKRAYKRLEKKSENDAKSKFIPLEDSSAYDVLKLVSPPYNLENLAILYEKNTAHNSAVTTKAINVVGLGYSVVESPETLLKLEQRAAKKKDKSKVDEIAFALKKRKLELENNLEEMNDDFTFTEICTMIWTDVESVGNGYMEIGRNNNGTIGYIGHVPGSQIRLRSSRDGFVQQAGNKYVFFRNFGDKETPNPIGNDDNPNELIHFTKYSPNSTYYGIPDIIPAMASVVAEQLAKEYNLDYFENKAVPRYVLITKGVRLSQDAETKLVNYFKNELKGKNHGTLYIPLPASMNQNVDARFEAIENVPQESSFINYVKEARHEILMGHRVPPTKVGLFDNSNLAISRDADKTFKEQVCRPEQRRCEKRVNKMFAELSGGEFLIKFDEADIIDSDVKSRMHDRYLRTQVMKPNEVRNEIGMTSVPEGEQFLPFPDPNLKANLGAPKKTSEGSKPDTAPQSAVGGRKERGEAQDSGQGRPNKVNNP